MAAGSRKRRRPDGRTASPPLGPSPLLTRNLTLLPVGLTQLPNDEAFVAQLRNDMDDLLSAFAEALLLKNLQRKTTTAQSSEASSSRIDPSTQPADTEQHVVSPFSVFAQIWREKGWHYVQFAFADHNESKRSTGDAICRVLLEHLAPYVSQRQSIRGDTQADEPSAFSFADLKQLLKIMAVPFALYMFWSTQLYPTSGIGVKHCRPAMERIPIEQDYYDLLLDLPGAVQKQLLQEERTRSLADAATADLVEVLCRLVGRLSEEEESSAPAPKTPKPVSSDLQAKATNRSRRRQAWQDDAAAGQHNAWLGSDPVFDVIPTSWVSTRLPRNWPSVRVLSSLEANKEFGRVGSIVRVSDGSAADPTRRSVEDEEASNERRRGGTTEVREAVAGLSRGDVVRLKARQRLAAASKNLSGLLELPSRSTASVPGPSSNPNVARERQGQAPHQSASPRYEIEVPSWVKSAKYTAAMQPWLEEASATRQESLQRVSRSKQRYHGSRDRVMQVSAATTSTATEEGGDIVREVDYGRWILRSFREERQALRSQAPVESNDGQAPTDRVPTDVNDAGSLSLDSLYRLAAERTKTAAVERGEMLKSARASGSRSR